jgi:hypothetical protein
MWREIPLSKYQTLLAIVMVERQETRENLSRTSLQVHSIESLLWLLLVVPSLCFSPSLDTEKRSDRSCDKCST